MRLGFIYTWDGSRRENRVDLKRCRAAVFPSGRGVRSRQCNSRGKHEHSEGGESFLFCATHHPEIETEAQKNRRERAAAKAKERDRYYSEQDAADRILDLLTPEILDHIGHAELRKAARQYVEIKGAK